MPRHKPWNLPKFRTLSYESDDSFPGEFSFMDCFKTQRLYLNDCSFVKSDSYSSSEVSHSSIPLFSSSEAQFISSDFDSLL